MTREELAEKVNELLIERATSETKTALHEKAMSLIDLYAESREIPPPPLKWEDTGSHLRAWVFGLRMDVYLSARKGGNYVWYASILGTPMLLSKEFDAEEKNEAIAWCEAKWKYIWEKEMAAGNTSSDPSK